MPHVSYHPYYYETRPLVLKAFRRLRRLGFVAKPNFLCCGTCASYRAFEIAKETGKTSVVWWHRQDEKNYRECGQLFLGFGHMDDVDDSTDGLGNQVGLVIAKALADVGLKIEWNGNSQRRICVFGKE